MKTEYQELYTEAGEKLKDQPLRIPWNVYPRPHLRRGEWRNLNGDWDFETESGYKGSIRVPFCPESLLSGFGETISYGEKLTYKRTFEVPIDWAGKNIILNLGAISRVSTVYLNGKQVGDTGMFAYFPRSIDITDELEPGENRLEIICINDLDPQFPYGKQKLKRGGMWYTPVSGIWQTVWIEPVPKEHIEEIACISDGDTVSVTVYGVSEGAVRFEGAEYPLKNGSCSFTVDSPRFWSPEEPNLYEFTAACGEDIVHSYFALRTVAIGASGGKQRILLNGKPYFFNGLLDQGYYSDGLWTPSEPAEYERDIMKAKSLGFNMLRKHIKIEPELFYYYCDRLGIAVFQDMVNNGKYRFFHDSVMPTIGVTALNDKRLHRDTETRECFLASMQETVRFLRCHPSIVYWTVFNEGWGQFDADRIYTALKHLDPTRIVDATSGWFRRTKSDVESLHIYFRKLHLYKHTDRPQVISEFGGFVYKLPNNSFNRKKTFGYKLFKTREQFVTDLRRLYSEDILPLIEKGLCAAVYTQLSDVEDETNGIMTYDRRIMKLLPEEFSDISGKLKNEQIREK